MKKNLPRNSLRLEYCFSKYQPEWSVHGVTIDCLPNHYYEPQTEWMQLVHTNLCAHIRYAHFIYTIAKNKSPRSWYRFCLPENIPMRVRIPFGYRHYRPVKDRLVQV